MPKVIMALICLALPLCGMDLTPALIAEIKLAGVEAQGAARIGLVELKRLTTAKTAAHLGFEDPEDAENAEIDVAHPYVVYVIPKGQLVQFDRHQPKRLLGYAGKVIFRVMPGKNAHGQVKATIITIKSERGWIYAGTGRYGDLFSNVSPETLQFLIQAPALDLWLAAERVRGDELFLTSLVSASSLGIAAGTRKPADEMLEGISLALKAF